MKPDTSSSPADADEEAWVEAELVRGLMRTQRTTQLLGLLLIPLMLAVLWPDVSHGALLAWTALAAAAAAARFLVLRNYVRDIAPRGPAEHLVFVRRWGIAWPLTGVAWGLSTMLYFDRASLEAQFVCWLVLSGLSTFAINTLSSHLATMRGYLDSLVATALTVMVWRLGVELRFEGPSYHWWMVLLLVIFWQVLRQAGQRQHATLRRNYELQYRNKQLIESLTRQTAAALDAVEIKNRFLASAAHDIRQPVLALGLYAGWLDDEPELVHELAPKIVESTKAVNSLFDSLFDLARLDSGRIKLAVEALRLDKLLQDLELHYRPLAEARGLRFRVHAVAGTVVSDPILLQRVVGNLIANAVKYTPRGGGVLVAARVGPAGARIEVWDTGVGIAPEHQKEIFREFYKVPGHAGTEEGFGLGLSIVARLTHILGHPLQLTSRPGRGTVFRLLVQPTDAPAATRRAAASVDNIRHGRPEVLDLPVAGAG